MLSHFKVILFRRTKRCSEDETEEEPTSHSCQRLLEFLAGGLSAVGCWRGARCLAGCFLGLGGMVGTKVSVIICLVNNIVEEMLVGKTCMRVCKGFRKSMGMPVRAGLWGVRTLCERASAIVLDGRRRSERLHSEGRCKVDLMWKRRLHAAGGASLPTNCLNIGQ